MGSALQLVQNSTKFAWTLSQAFFDFGRHSRKADSRLNETERSEWLHHWCRRSLERMGATLNVVGRPPASGLIVSNHISYLDILCLGAAMRCVFVSKAEVRDWPFIGSLTTMAGTVYVDRSRKSGAREANEGMRRALQEGMPVVVFPEGTTSDGSGVLPFHASLFASAVDTESPITAAYLAYEVADGDVALDVAYVGDVMFIPHLLKLMSKRGLSATVTFGEAPRVFSDRKTAAAEMREEVLKLRG